jgi:5-methylcytosine-specific restriction protein A
MTRLSRRISLRKNEREIGNKRGPNGHRLCRWCEKEVDPPRITFCSNECVHNWKLRSNIKYLRQHVYMRDCGICARCNKDTRLLKIKLEDLRAVLLREVGKEWEQSETWTVCLRENHLTRKEAWKSLWHADHILPVTKGGGQCGISGIQSLCIQCHKKRHKVNHVEPL